MSRDLIPSQEEIKSIEIMAENAHKSKYFDKIGGYEGIFAIAMYAREMGLPIMTSLFGGMQNIQGKITIAPQLMNSMIRKAGHTLDIQSSDIKCTIKGTRKDTGESNTVSFSIEDAKKAGIYKNAWEKYPSDMCFARALSRLARRLFPDVIGMAYVEGEIEEVNHKKERPSKIEESPAIEIPNEIDENEFIENLISACSKFEPNSSLIIECIEDRRGSYSREKYAERCLKDLESFEEFYLSWKRDKSKKGVEIESE